MVQQVVIITILDIEYLMRLVDLKFQEEKAHVWVTLVTKMVLYYMVEMLLHMALVIVVAVVAVIMVVVVVYIVAVVVVVVVTPMMMFVPMLNTPKDMPIHGEKLPSHILKLR